MTIPTVLVATDNGLHRIGTRAGRALPGRPVDHVVPAGDRVWAIVDGTTVSEIEGEQVTWRADLADDRALCVLVGRVGVWIGAARASLWRLADGALARVTAFDDAPGRERWHTPWGGPPDVRSMGEDRGGSVYVNVHVGGVLRSGDGGESWTETMDIHADVHQVIADPDRTGHAYAATARGVAITTDGARTWDFSTAGLHAPYCRAVARSTSTLFLSASDGPGGARAALYRRAVDGGPFHRCAGGLPEWFSKNLDTHCLAARGDVVVAGDSDGTLFASTDEGSSWEVVADRLGSIRAVALA